MPTLPVIISNGWLRETVREAVREAVREVLCHTVTAGSLYMKLGECHIESHRERTLRNRFNGGLTESKRDRICYSLSECL